MCAEWTSMDPSSLYISEFVGSCLERHEKWGLYTKPHCVIEHQGRYATTPGV